MRLVYKYELISNQTKKVVLVKIIFIVCFNKLLSFY